MCHEIPAMSFCLDFEKAKELRLAVVSFRCKDLRSKIQRASRKSMKSALARPRTGSASSAASAQWKDDSTNVTTPAPAKATPIVALSFLVLEGNLVPVLLVSPDRDHSGACDCKQLAAVCAVTFGDILPHPARARRKADTLFLILLQR